MTTEIPQLTPSRITKGTPSYKLLSNESIVRLAKIPDYPLDYNIYVFQQITDTRNNLTKEELKEIFQSFQQKQGNFNGNVNGKDEAEQLEQENGNRNAEQKRYLTKTAEMHDRLLHYLILERKRREKIVLKKYLSDEISKRKNQDPVENKLQVDLQLLEEEEEGILQYKIRSPIYNTLIQSSPPSEEAPGTGNSANGNDKVKKGLGQFKRFATVQNIEYKFEEELNDNELVELFADCEEFKKFELIYNDLRKNNANKIIAEAENEDQIEGNSQKQIKDKTIDKIIDQLTNENIIRLMIPLAGQAILSGIDISASSSSEKR